MTRFVCSVTIPVLAGLGLALPSPALAVNVFCPPLFVTDGDQVVCAAALRLALPEAKPIARLRLVARPV